MKYHFLFFFVLSSFVSFGQSKKFKNQYAYKADSTIFSFIKCLPTERTEHCKLILINQKKEQKEGEVWERDWTVEKIELLESKQLFVVNNQWLNSEVVNDTIGGFILGTKKGIWLGPYKSDYGQFRFLEITFNSAVLSNNSGVSKSYNWKVFSKKKGSAKCLKKQAQDFLTYYRTGKGNIDVLERKFLKIKADKIDANNFLDAPNTKQKIDSAPFGQSYFILDMEENIVLLRLFKTNNKEQYVSYNEYIFK